MSPERKDTMDFSNGRQGKPINVENVDSIKVVQRDPNRDSFD